MNDRCNDSPADKIASSNNKSVKLIQQNDGTFCIVISKIIRQSR